MRSYYRTKQTELIIESIPPSKVYINNEYTGTSPIITYLEYEQKIDKKTRKVSYWTTQPGLSLFLSIISLGIYIPFSIIPVDIETSLISADSFTANEFIVHLEAKGYKDWHKKILCTGQDKISLQYKLEVIAEE